MKRLFLFVALLIILGTASLIFPKIVASAIPQCTFTTSPSPAVIGQPATFYFSKLETTATRYYLIFEGSEKRWQLKSDGSVDVSSVEKNNFALFQDGVTRLCDGYATGVPTTSGFQPTRCDPATGQEREGGPGILTALGCIPVRDTAGFIGWVLRLAIGIGGGIAFLLMLFGVFQIITSSGDPERLKAGKELITSALIGLLMIIFSLFLLRLIGVEILKIPGFG